MIRLVPDTNVVVSGLLWDGAPKQLLDEARSSHLQLMTSYPLLLELERTLSRQKFAPRIGKSGYSLREVIEHFSYLTTLVEPVPIPRIAPDPDDDIVLATALAADADFIATGDTALRSVGIYHGVRLITPAQALLLIRESLPPR